MNNIAMQSEISITDLPQPVIRHIAEYLIGDKGLSSFAVTCRYLHASATPENVLLSINCANKRTSEPVHFFLDRVFTCMQHIVARNGNNTINLHLNGNNLSDDPQTLSNFLYHCAQSPAGPYLTELDLGNNQLKSIPSGLVSLNNLNKLALYNNLLKKEDLQQLVISIHESLKTLKFIDVSNNQPLTISDVYHTIVQCKTLDYIYAQEDDKTAYTYHHIGKKLCIAISSKP
jgi:Leucine-rich repeat (LRR) protein